MHTTRRSFIGTVGVAFAAASIPGAAFATARRPSPSSGPIGAAASNAIRGALQDYPTIRFGEGRKLSCVMWIGCPHTQRLLREYPDPPQGMSFEFAVVPSDQAPRRAYNRLFASRTPEAFREFMGGQYNSLPRSIDPAGRQQFLAHVASFRNLERALAMTGLRPISPLFLWDAGGHINYVKGYDPRLLREMARGEVILGAAMRGSAAGESQARGRV